MDYFFNPRTVALIGASSKKGRIGFEILQSLLQTKAIIYPVNPKEEFILGKKCYKTIHEIPDSIDLLVVSVSANQMPNIVEEAHEKGVKGIVIISGGFKEVSDEGAELEKKVKEKAKSYNIRVIGPNCIGVYSGESEFNTFFQAQKALSRPKNGDIAFITQSGTYGVTLLEYLEQNSLGVSKFVSFGNKIDVNELDMLQYFENDKNTKIIAAYLESIEEGRAFFEVARKVAKTKPIVILKTGKNMMGNKTAKSHTGALAQNYEVFKGAMKQAGVIVVDDIEDLVDIIKILSFQKLPKNGNLAMITNGAGPCVLTSDEIGESKYIKMSVIKDYEKKELEKILPEFAIIANPLDLTGSATPDWYKAGFDTLGHSEDVEIIVSYFVVPNAPIFNNIENMIEVMKSTKELDKTVIAVMAGGQFTKNVEKNLQDLSVPVLTTARRVVHAVDKIVEYSIWRTMHN